LSLWERCPGSPSRVLVIELTPGPNMAYLAILSATKGRRAWGGLVYLLWVASTVAHSAVVLLANVARPWLEDERRSTIVRRALSLLLVGIAVWLFVTTRQIEP
jgi:threonine/homoserine/homoserine lactone efflux protein